jgi:hypothetical protein
MGVPFRYGGVSLQNMQDCSITEDTDGTPLQSGVSHYVGYRRVLLQRMQRCSITEDKDCAQLQMIQMCFSLTEDTWCSLQTMQERSFLRGYRWVSCTEDTAMSLFKRHRYVPSQRMQL